MANKAKKATKAKKTKKATRKVSARTGAARGAASKKVGKKGRAGGASVSVGLHGMNEILGKIKDAGLEHALNAELGDKDLFVKLQRTTLTKLKNFIDNNSKLSSLSEATSRCNCPPWDPYCIYLG